MDRQGNLTRRRGSYLDGPATETSVTALSSTRLAVSYRDDGEEFLNDEGESVDKCLLQVRTLDIGNDGTLSLVGSEQAGEVGSTRTLRVSSSVFATFVQTEREPWTGNDFGLLGGNTGNRLVHLDPWTKIKLGWLELTEITRSGMGAVFPMGNPAAEAIIVRDPNHRDTEYFIVEARNKDSIYESGLKDEGLAIWHVDESRVDADTHERPVFLSLEWLGGTPETALWDPQDSTLDVYDDSSSPAGSRWSDFSASGISISQIQSFWGIISFQVDFQ